MKAEGGRMNGGGDRGTPGPGFHAESQRTQRNAERFVDEEIVWRVCSLSRGVPGRNTGGVMHT